MEESEVRRRSIAPIRHALGYQDGHCFYSALPIEHDGDNVCHVGLIPHKFQKHMAELGVNVDGVWNLVLAEAGVNLSNPPRPRPGPEKLSARNEFYIASKHPLAETIVNQTGYARAARLSKGSTARRSSCRHRQTWIPQCARCIPCHGDWHDHPRPAPESSFPHVQRPYALRIQLRSGVLLRTEHFS